MRNRSETGAASAQAARKVKHPYITLKKSTCAGKPIIAGTRIKVEQIAIEYEWQSCASTLMRVFHRR